MKEKKTSHLSKAMLFILLFGIVSLFSDMTHEGASFFAWGICRHDWFYIRFR